MEVFSPILNQMVFLFGFIVIGFILSKWKFVPDDSARVISKLENILFVPALAMGTFIKSFNVSVLTNMWKLLLASLALLAVFIPVSMLFAKICFKEARLRKIAAYGLAFSNFGFMGNAIMSAVFPEIFSDYIIFTLPIWSAIYLWGAPVLLIAGSDDSGAKVPLKQRLKAFVNPMIVGMLIGMIIGLTGLKLPTGLQKVIDVSGECMSPLAMLLTGLTIGKIDLLALLKKWRIYLTTAIKLFAYPLIFFLIALVLPHNSFFNDTFFKCGMCFATMPMGLNTIVIPAAYGKDTTDAAGLALVSHIVSVITIPLFFMLLQTVVL
ncbi:MAG: AEC family transporter [Clostridia bacterium]|nr:AEC family transporter [Clostridia bacterium]